MSDALAPITANDLGGGDSLVVDVGDGGRSPRPDEFVSFDELPVCLIIQPPVYPDLARQAGIDGTVMVQTLVGKDGKVKEAHVVEGPEVLHSAAVASVRAYGENRVRKHELTRPDKETDRVRNMEALNAQTGPVLCAFQSTAGIDQVLRDATRALPLLEAEGPHTVMHTIWRIAEAERLVTLSRELCSLPALYIADGHHRTAAAARVAEARRAKTNAPDDAASYEYFLCVAFPSTALRIHDYNRVVADLNGLSATKLLERIEAAFEVTRVAGVARPEAQRTFGLYVDGHWYRLRARRKPAGDAVARLDVSVLHRELIEPVLGIHDVRTDRRIDFVGGIRGLEALVSRVDSGKAAAAFALYPPSMDELIAVADAGLLMPPKSTWFEPKLADGLLTHVLD